MSSIVDFDVDTDYHFARGLRAYVARVAKAVGVGYESCSVDPGVPSSAYLALDWRLTRFPGHDLALLWDETHGWSAVVEPPGGGETVVLAYLGGTEVLPDPRAVVLFVAAVRMDDPAVGRRRRPVFRTAGRHEELLDRLPVTAGEALLRPGW